MLAKIDLNVGPLFTFNAKYNEIINKIPKPQICKSKFISFFPPFIFIIYYIKIK